MDITVILNQIRNGKYQIAFYTYLLVTTFFTFVLNLVVLANKINDLDLLENLIIKLYHLILYSNVYQIIFEEMVDKTMVNINAEINLNMFLHLVIDTNVVVDNVVDSIGLIYN